MTSVSISRNKKFIISSTKRTLEELPGLEEQENGENFKTVIPTVNKISLRIHKEFHMKQHLQTFAKTNVGNNM